MDECVVVLPLAAPDRPPSIDYKDAMFLRKEGNTPWEQQRSDARFQRAFVTASVGMNQVPVPGEWAAFTLAGSVIASLTHHFPYPPIKTDFMQLQTDIELYAWEILWNMRKDLCMEFGGDVGATVLRIFFPRARHASSDHPYFMSDFASRWTLERYADSLPEWIGNLRIAILKDGFQLLDECSPLERAVIDAIRIHTPTMTKLVMRYFKNSTSGGCIQ